jgi:hypothetical protein
MTDASAGVTPVGNIGRRGCQRRRTGGYVWLVIVVIALGWMLYAHVSRGALLFLAIPMVFAAAGLLQAREQTCVVHAMLGTRENDDGVLRLDPRDAPDVRRRAWRVGVQALATALVATIAIYLLAGLR